MSANLARIPADGDAAAEAILRRAVKPVDSHLVESLDESACLALGRYGARLPTIALRERSAERLTQALLATAIASLGDLRDERDLLVVLAVHFFVAEELHIEPSALFGEVADHLPPGPVVTLLRTFGARSDITLRAFGWNLVQTADGPDFVPA